jgi:cation:H+ antiporter
LVTAIAAQRRREPDLVVGNLLGSNMFNSLAGGSIIGLAAPANASSTINATLLIAMVVTMLLAFMILFRGRRVSRAEGVLLIVAYLAVLPMLL